MGLQASYFIDKYNMQKHPEGGYYTEIYRAETVLDHPRNRQKRNTATSIYFMLNKNNKSHFHQLSSDELWYFHYGCAVAVHMLVPDGSYRCELLGSGEKKGEHPQVIIPAGTIFAAENTDINDFSFFGCVVTPGFHFDDFKLLTRNELVRQFPEHEKLIKKFTANE